MSATFQFLSGAYMMACAVVSLFFFRSWQKTRDRLFISFGIAFLLLALERIVLLIQSANNLPEDHPLVYLIRLIAFGMIIFGITGKNRSN